MSYVIAEPCVGVKDGACVEICPTDCIHTNDDAPQFYINPQECLNCDACELECPVGAIFEADELPAKWMEIIEIGAVFLPSASEPPSGEFAAFVRPVASRTLSEFCTTLTSIQQKDVDGADEFWAVFPRFVEWCGDEPFTLCSWGAYDLNQIRADCRRHNLPFPTQFERHLNLKSVFTEVQNVRRCGMVRALQILGIPLQCTHHRGIDDAHNIAQIANRVLPIWKHQKQRIAGD